MAKVAKTRKGCVQVSLDTSYEFCHCMSSDGVIIGETRA